MKIDSDYLILEEKEKKFLIAKFKLLTTITEKYTFWETNFNYDYSLHYNLQPHTISDFLIVPKNKEETEILNKSMYGSYVAQTDDNESSIFKGWKNQFIQNLEKAPDKELVKELEINRISEYVTKKRQPSRLKSLGRGAISVFDIKFLDGYDRYLMRMEEFDWGECLYDNPLFFHNILKGIECAKYFLFVRNYNVRQKEEPEIILNGEQKFLVLHYLGFGEDVETKTSRANLFGYFIDDLKSKTMRPMFSNPESFETYENLDIIISFLKQFKLNALVKELEAKRR